MGNRIHRGRRHWVTPVAVGSVLGTVGLAAGGATVAGGAERARAGDAQAENVILFVGDGMGYGARDAGRLSLKGLDGALVMDRLPVAGTARTHSVDPETFVTDSAAAGTSLATGVKTFNGAIGVDAQGNRVRTLLERAERAGLSTGVVTTAQVTDATPAAFGSHVQDRAQQSEIARQMIEKAGVDVILGGGEDFWYPAGNTGAYPDAPPEDPTEGSRSDRGNLVDRARELGYEYVTDAAGLQAAEGRKAARPVREPGDVPAASARPKALSTTPSCHCGRWPARRSTFSRGTRTGSSCWSRRKPSTRWLTGTTRR